MRSRVLLCALVLAATAAPARAALVFDRNPGHPSVWIAADDGSGARRIGSGSLPKVAPDGRTVVYQVQGNAKTFRDDLVAVPADASAPPRVLVKAWRDPSTFAWSPDSRTVVTVFGPELGPKRLDLVDVATGTRRTIARGFFYGVSFSPAGDQVVYARTASDRYPPGADLYRAPVAGGAPVRVTRDKRALYPLWGPTGRIVFARLVDAARRKYGPKSELYLIGPDGSGLRRLTKTVVGQLLTGLFPTAWSADGAHLLAEFGGQDTSYAETVDPVTGAHRPVIRAEENGFVGADLSADGTTILGAVGGFDPDAHHDVATVPYGGGPVHVLVRNAANPDWNR